ncbi:uncharacterized protein LOC124899566 [Capsicum annuum]|uniref:uncharacterized protein LOC124899566 n=1 Tax=Capsicum annuum TaxID=4072 RepID=UPI001FB0F87D|nr:uncharacterized protein LOC124899566 [Capsicum annuum]
MDILITKLRAQGWSHLFLQGDHQRKFGKDEVYEFYINGVAIGQMFSTTVHGKTINIYLADLARILNFPIEGWGYYMKDTQILIDLPQLMIKHIQRVLIQDANGHALPYEFWLASIFEIFMYQSNYVLLCKSQEYSWLFKASCKLGADTFVVRTFNDEHTCSIMDRAFEQQHAIIGFIARITAPKLVNHKRIITPSDIIEDIKRELGLVLYYMMTWCAKERALNILRGRPTAGYKKTPTYGFGYCRPVVVLDGSHMSGPYKGTFVSASTLDGAGHILPLAYGVVDSENDSSWMWFFQKSKEKLTGEFFAMTKAYRLDDFDELMCKVGKIDNKVKAYLKNAGFEKWSRVHALINRGRMMTSNIAECLNSHLVEARELPILDFLEQIRESTNYIYSVYEEGRKYIVRLDNRTCNCGRFQLDEIPCAHAIAVLKSKHVKKMKPYCSDYYKKETLVKTYEMPLCPMPDK